MPPAGPVHLYLGIAILIDYEAGIRNARAVDAGVAGLISRLTVRHAKLDELIDEILAAVAGKGYAAQLVGRAPEAIEFRVTKR